VRQAIRASSADVDSGKPDDSTTASNDALIAVGCWAAFGVAPPQAEWGFMLSSLRDSIYTNPWVSIVPGAMIFITSMALNVVSDGLREAMDVRL